MTDGIVVVVTGGREYRDWAAVDRTLTALHAARPIRRLAHGAARGADTLAARWAKRQPGMEVEPYPVTRDDWRLLGKAAGPARNRLMLECEDPDLVVAFPGGRGTRDMVAQATNSHIEVLDLREVLR